MAKVFEDYFMEIQERILSTCLEALQDTDVQVDCTYIYAFWSKSQVFFNVFFKKGNDVMGYGKLGVADNLVYQVLDFGKSDIKEIANLFVEYNRNPPNQYKLVYNNQTHEFDSDYNYDDLEKSKLGPMDVFMKWREKVASNK